MNFWISQVAAILHVLMSRNGLWMDMTNIYSSLEANKPLLEEAGEPHCLSVIHRQRPPNLVVRPITVAKFVSGANLRERRTRYIPLNSSWTALSEIYSVRSDQMKGSFAISILMRVVTRWRCHRRSILRICGRTVRLMMLHLKPKL